MRRAVPGLGAPHHTPPEILEQLDREVNALLAAPGVRARLAELGLVVAPVSRSDFAKLIADETEKWARVVKFAGIKPA